MSRRTAWASGMSGAPLIPCNRRKSTIWVRFWARPHRADATVKQATDTRKTFLRPNRMATAPVRGVMIAADTM